MSKAQLETAAEMTEEAADAVELMLAQGTLAGDESVQPARRAAGARGRRVRRNYSDAK